MGSCAPCTFGCALAEKSANGICVLPHVYFYTVPDAWCWGSFDLKSIVACIHAGSCAPGTFGSNSGAIRERHLRAAPVVRVHFYTVDGKGCVFNLLESDLRFIHQ